MTRKPMLLPTLLRLLSWILGLMAWLALALALVDETPWPWHWPLGGLLLAFLVNRGARALRRRWEIRNVEKLLQRHRQLRRWRGRRYRSDSEPAPWRSRVNR